MSTALPNSNNHRQEPTTTSVSSYNTVVNTSPVHSHLPSHLDHARFNTVDGLPSSSGKVLSDDHSRASPPTSPMALLEGSYPPVIPPDHTSRTLVLCFDGTGDQFDNDNSNIVQLVTLLKKDDSTKQLVYYQVSHLPYQRLSWLTCKTRLGLAHTPRCEQRIPL